MGYRVIEESPLLTLAEIAWFILKSIPQGQ